MKKTWIGLAVVAALVAATIGWSGQAPAQTKSDTPSASVPAARPEGFEGTGPGTKARNGLVTLRGNAGQPHSSRGDARTLNELKVGDRTTLNKRDQAAPAR